MSAPAAGSTDGVPQLVLVTGAAGAIGGAAVQGFLRAGFHVVGLDRSPDVTERAAERYRGYVVDVRDDQMVHDTIAEAVTGGSLRHLVGVAGGALPEEPRTQDHPAALSVDSFRSSLELNLISQFTVLRAALTHMLTREPADRSVTLTSSFNALSGQGMPAYSAAKAGLIGMMHALTGPLGAHGIRVNVVAPGTIRTPRTESLYRDTPGHFERLTGTTALGRLGSPEDVADAFVALAGSLRHVTGQVLVVDGGQMVKRR